MVPKMKLEESSLMSANWPVPMPLFVVAYSFTASSMRSASTQVTSAVFFSVQGSASCHWIWPAVGHSTPFTTAVVKTTGSTGEFSGSVKGKGWMELVRASKHTNAGVS